MRTSVASVLQGGPARAVLLVGAYVAAAKLSFALAFVNTSISPVWLPSGLAVAATAWFGYRAVPAVWLGALIFNALTPVPLWLALVISLGNAGEALVAGWLLRRVKFRVAVDRVRDVLALSVLGAVLATAVSATVGVAGMVAAGRLAPGSIASSWLLWWSGDGIGVFTVAPVLLVSASACREGLVPHWRRLAEAAAMVVLVPSAMAAGMRGGIARPFLVFPILVWAAIRFRRAGANLASLFISAVVVYASTHGIGPFVAGSMVDTLVATQSFIAVVMATSLLLAAMTIERERTTEALRSATHEVLLRNGELEAERGRLREAQHIAQLGSWDWDVATGAVHWTEELFDIYGLPRTSALTYRDYLDRVHPGDRKMTAAVITAALRDPAPFAVEHRIIRPDGRLRTLQTRGLVDLGDGAGDGTVRRMFGTSLDITELRRAQDALRVQQEQTQAIIDGASDAFVSIDDRGVITGWNRSAEALFGWGAEEAIGRTLVSTVVPVAARRAHLDALRRVVAGGAGRLLGRRIETTGLHRDGRELPVDLSVWRVRSQVGQQFHAFVRDISERRRVERDLASARDEAVAASRLKSQFLATMSHEIRTPMNAVIGLTTLALTHPLDDHQRRRVEGIHSAGQTLLAIINDILDLSKIEAGQLALDDADFDLDAVLGEAVGMVAEQARVKDLTVTASRDPGLPPRLRGDPARLRQILLNLTSNAVKFTTHGSVTVHATAHLSGVRVDVTDTGVGIPAHKLAQIFDPFVQADASTTRQYGGTGLGLAISRRLAEAMGGRLDVRSRPGVGSTFSCTLPLGPAREPAPAQAGRELDLAPGTGPAGYGRLLLVEDNEINQVVAIETLALLGYQVDLAANGSEALEMAELQHYAAILMDCQMPVMDGFAATVELRHREAEGDHVPIIAMTAGAFDEDRDRCLAAGMDDFVAKPIDVDLLADTVARWTH